MCRNRTTFARPDQGAKIPEDRQTTVLSESARRHFLAIERRPFLVADWLETVMIHYAAEAEILQRQIPFRLDVRGGTAYVSVVAFRMNNFRFAGGGRIAAKLLRGFAARAFLNLRTYVRHGDETGIYFLAEWLPNRLSILPGRLLFGLPYRFGRLAYVSAGANGALAGRVEAGGGAGAFAYRGEYSRARAPSQSLPGSLDEFLMERYAAFTKFGPMHRFFRIWHPPWPQARIDVDIEDDSLLRRSGAWFRGARLACAHHSPGFREVWIGRPRWTRPPLRER